MHRLHQLMIWSLLLISPARIVTAIPVAAAPAQTYASASAKTAPYQSTLDTSKPSPVVIEAPATPNYDTEVLQPLQAAQAQEAADAAALAAAEAAEAAKRAELAKRTPVVIPGEDVFAQLRYCEAGGDYTRNSGNGYFGAYQYNLGSWNNYGGFARADLAPASVQDEKAHADVARRGFSPWPACARKLGLM